MIPDDDDDEMSWEEDQRLKEGREFDKLQVTSTALWAQHRAARMKIFSQASENPPQLPTCRVRTAPFPDILQPAVSAALGLDVVNNGGIIPERAKLVEEIPLWCFCSQKDAVVRHRNARAHENLGTGDVPCPQQGLWGQLPSQGGPNKCVSYGPEELHVLGPRQAANE